MQYQQYHPLVEEKSYSPAQPNLYELPQPYDATSVPIVVQPFPTNQPIYLQPVPVPVPETKFGFISQHHLCQFCGSQIITQIQNKNGLLTWLLVGGLCIIGLGWGCCLAPFCIDQTKDVEHLCPNCHRVVAISHRLHK